MNITVKPILNCLMQTPVTLLTAVVCLLAYLTPSSFSIFELAMGSQADWSVTKTIGCHLLHWNGEHLFWDLGMFVVLGAICERSTRFRTYWTLLISAILIPFAVAVAHPEISSYRGLSGLDTAIFSLLVIQKIVELRRVGDKSWWVFAFVYFLLCGKILFEFPTGTTLFVQDTSFVPIPVAHVAGALIGLLLGLPFESLWTTAREIRARLQGPTAAGLVRLR